MNDAQSTSQHFQRGKCPLLLMSAGAHRLEHNFARQLNTDGICWWNYYTDTVSVKYCRCLLKCRTYDSHCLLLTGLMRVLSHRKQTFRCRQTTAGRRCDSCVHWIVETSRATFPADLHPQHSMNSSHQAYNMSITVQRL